MLTNDVRVLFWLIKSAVNLYPQCHIRLDEVSSGDTVKPCLFPACYTGLDIVPIVVRNINLRSHSCLCVIFVIGKCLFSMWVQLLPLPVGGLSHLNYFLFGALTQTCFYYFITMTKQEQKICLLTPLHPDFPLKFPLGSFREKKAFPYCCSNSAAFCVKFQSPGANKSVWHQSEVFPLLNKFFGFWLWWVLSWCTVYWNH